MARLGRVIVDAIAAPVLRGAMRNRPVADRTHEGAAMGVELFRVILPVTDIDRAARFYSEVLGIDGRRVSPGRHYFDCGGTILACFDPGSDGDGYVAPPNPEWLYFAVDDLEARFEAARRAGATPSAEDVHGEPAGRIARRPWGERSFYVEDPFGNKLCFVDRATKFTGD
jgi:catechol 2,3-dioxygenase-like lactoylglutathione lyase family enzyme